MIYAGIGILASVLYIVTVFISLGLRSDYSYTVNEISELTITGSSNFILLVMLFSIYNVLSVLFELFGFIIEKKQNIFVRLCFLMFIILGIYGFLMFFFPMDIGSETTFKCIIHLELAGIISPMSILLILFGGINYKTADKKAPIKFYSIA